METKHLIAIEKWTCLLAAIVVAAAVLVLSRRTAFGVSLGAGLMALNAWALRRIGQRAFRAFKRPGAAVLLFNVKMFVLVGIIFLIIRYLPVDPVGFVVGISIFPLAIVAVAIQHALRIGAAPSNNEETHG